MSRDWLERIANHVVINASFVPSLGLYQGKMGIVLFLFHYAKHSGQVVYEDFAGELIDQICQEVSGKLPLGFANGLCGIGWAITYLLRHGFIEGDADEVLFEFDRKVQELNLKNIKDETWKTGIKGITAYLQSRFLLPECANYSQDFCDQMDAVVKRDRPYNDLSVFRQMIKVEQLDHFPDHDLSLETGCAGYGIKKLLL